MGQLEKYGLYVLCLVIFLILGVAIWGGDPQPAYAGGSAEKPISARGTEPPQTKREQPRNEGSNEDLDAFVHNVVQPKAKAEEAASGGDGKKADKKGDAKKSEEKPAVGKDEVRPLYKVKDGDRFVDIARKELGNAHYAGEIAKLNPTVNPSKMPIGKELVMPSKADIARLIAEDGKAKSALAKTDEKAKAEDKGTKPAAGTYTVREGDILGTIALKQLGTSKRAAEIQELNPTLDPLKLKAGMVLKMPQK